MAGYCFTTRGYATCSDTEKTSSTASTPAFWHDRDQRSRIIASLRDRGGQLLNEKAVWRTKSGQLLDLLLTYAQVAYRGGHISFVGGKRVLWVYDVTALTSTSCRWSNRSASFAKSWTTVRRRWASSTRKGGSSFHNWRMRDLLGYEKHELEIFRHQAVLARPRSSRRIIECCERAAASCSTKRWSGRPSRANY